jgi:uncharacterized protein
MRSYTGGDKARLVLPALGLLCLGAVAGAATRNYPPFPQPDAGYVTDTAGLLTEEQEQQMEGWLRETEQRSGIEILVVTLRSLQEYPGTPNRTIEEFARALFDRYGIGNMPKNKGVLLLVVVQDRKARIELGAGYGHVRDRDAKRIMARKIVPCFRQDRYAEGITGGVKALTKEFGGMTFAGRPFPWVLVGGVFVVLLLVAISLFRNGKRGWGWVVAGSTVVLALALLWLGRRTVEALATSDDQPGGFGGFGGGFSGGGGATGSW